MSHTIKPSVPVRARRGQWVYFWWSASYVHGVKLVRWVRMRNGTGREDTNQIGVGAIVSSDWLFARELIERIPSGLRRGQYRLRPYTDLYRSSRDARMRCNPVRRPSVARCRA